MSQDPNQPNTGYGSDPQNPYGTPQHPYQAMPEPTPSDYNPTPNPPPYQEQPVNPSANPYGTPLEGGVHPNAGTPPNNPYGAPPQGQPGYSAAPVAGFAFSGQGPYGQEGQVPLTPLPLSVALKQLPRQYLHVLTHPGRPLMVSYVKQVGISSGSNC